MLSAEQRQLFLNAEGQWSEDASGAVMRIASEIRAEPRVRNAVYRRSEQGWDLVEDQNALSGLEAGLFFKVSPAPRGDRHLVAFESARFIDREMLAGPLRGLQIINDAGEVVSEPMQCGERFLLRAEDAKQFATQIQGAGGVIVRGEASDIEQTQNAVENVNSELERLTDMLQLDLDCLDAVADGDFSGQLQFDQRGAAFRQLSADLAIKVGKIRERIAGAIFAETDSAARARLAEFKEHLAQVQANLEELRQSRSRAEELLTTALHSESKSAPTSTSPVARQMLLRDLAGFARLQGLEVSEQAGIVEIQLGAQKLVVDDDGLRLS